MKKPTMRDIAKAVGTSAVTVSNAMAGKPGMSEQLRADILRKAEEMGYEYPKADRTPQAPLPDIGILVPDRYFETESFYSGMYRQLVRKLTEKGYFGLLEILSREDEKAGRLPNLIRSGRAGGLIMLGETEKAYYRAAAQAGVPVVYLDFYDDQANADAVVGDNAYGTYRLTSHLIRRGHTKIGFVGNRLATGSIMDRYLGFYRAMLTHGLPAREEWILEDRDEEGRTRRPELPREMPTALVCNCDLTARMMIDLLREKGFRVPEDVSVTGFDDYPPAAENETGLSTYRVDTEAMIDMAVKMITERCRGTDKPFARMVISGQPVYRGSEISLNGEE